MRLCLKFHIYLPIIPRENICSSYDIKKKLTLSNRKIPQKPNAF